MRLRVGAHSVPGRLPARQIGHLCQALRASLSGLEVPLQSQSAPLEVQSGSHSGCRRGQSRRLSSQMQLKTGRMVAGEIKFCEHKTRVFFFFFSRTSDIANRPKLESHLKSIALESPL